MEYKSPKPLPPIEAYYNVFGISKTRHNTASDSVGKFLFLLSSASSFLACALYFIFPFE